MGSAGGKVPFNEKIFKDITSSSTFIGKGAFGDVYGPCIWRKETYAIKTRMFSTDMPEADQDRQKVHAACEKWKSLNHKNLITVYDVIFDPPALYILMEYAKGGSLKVVLSQCKSDLSPEIQLNWSTQIADGMAYLHKQMIIHRDLKSPNSKFYIISYFKTHIYCGQTFQLPSILFH